MSWRERELVTRVQKHADAHSPDPDTKVACWLLSYPLQALVKRCNTLPDGVAHTANRWHKPAKYDYVVHAEANAIAAAAKAGVSTDGATAVVNLFPCASCAKLLIQSGIKRVVTNAPDMQNIRWQQEFALARDLLHEGGIHVIEL